MTISIRTLRRDEVPIAMAFARSEGWNPGLHDDGPFYAADPQGFLVAEESSEAIGCIAAVSYADRADHADTTERARHGSDRGFPFGFIGLFVVAPSHRGRGIGRLLWDAAMTRLAGHVIGLDGVPAQQDFYRRNGFELAWQNARFAGHGRRADDLDPPSTPSQIVPLASVDFALLCADDRRVFPARREAFLRRWIASPDATGLAWIDKGKFAGWGLIRRSVDGHKIGPLTADDAAIADALYTALCNTVSPNEPVFLDVPLPNKNALALAKAHNLESVFETARMFAGPAPSLELDRVYGITSFELG